MDKKYWFIFHEDNLLLERKENGDYTIPYCSQSPIPPIKGTNILNIKPFEDGEMVKAFSIDEPIIDSTGHYSMCKLRESYYKLSNSFYLKAGKCHELLYWDKSTHYCGYCGAPMVMHSEISKCCTNCQKEIWPKLATAIIVLIHRGEEVLLVHARNFKKDFYGLVAGFVETGETLEEAVYREVKEETGLNIKNLSYHASQPWPYPCGLMVGFFAEYDSGELSLQYSELSKGGWFHYTHLPQLPEKLSLARQLIDQWLFSLKKDKI